ncbi:hypothetical protein [Pedobacter africanus]|uniref:Lipoprotein n=1 Tax=Pedobacter africanus TaxID=151894 RepID=A0A1W2CNM1_9SPHI|nr:hypothetical protein [Pedobacter africanus]SMC86837.1 hypothetical protein SAMN04488524_3060 [Pedobacter africanus]
MIKPLTIILAVAVLFVVSCKKKEGPTVTELGNMAEAKLNEIKTLSAGIPCAQLNDVAVKEISEGCSAAYYLVKSSDLTRFEQLKKEYFDLLRRQTDAMVKQGIIIDPCFESYWIAEQPIKTICNSFDLKLITSQNISIEEAKPLADQTYQEIKTIIDAQTCTGEADWTYTVLIKDRIGNVEYVPYLRSRDYSVLKKKISLYNRLRARIITEQAPADYVPNKSQVEKIECVNGKPVVKLKN